MQKEKVISNLSAAISFGGCRFDDELDDFLNTVSDEREDDAPLTMRSEHEASCC